MTDIIYAKLHLYPVVYAYMNLKKKDESVIHQLILPLYVKKILFFLFFFFLFLFLFPALVYQNQSSHQK